MSIREQQRLARLRPTPAQRQEHIISAIEKRVRKNGGDALDFVMEVSAYYHSDDRNRAHAKRLGLLDFHGLATRYGG